MCLDLHFRVQESAAWTFCHNAHVARSSQVHRLASDVLPSACPQVWQEEGVSSTLVGIVRLHLEQQKLCEALSGADNGAPMCQGACLAVTHASDPCLQQAAAGLCVFIAACGCSEQLQMLMLPFCTQVTAVQPPCGSLLAALART